ncbi:hypothetical protein SLEP1_g48331 [Rubroshorea leprosula]|uniref:Uncharacterized protein n=1 Tax=Rubroshorea leprosula TaxID=152421 RepID=A0AAV5LWA2_9ROSI|nr:hypothetical protein SLEP1_g48331 [Rubroshorea leprosula]
MAQSCMLAWNYHNLGEAYMIFEPNQLCLQKKPNFVLLPTTKQTGMEMNLFQIDLGLAHYSESDCAERGGGLTLLWNDAFNLQVSFFSPYHIDVEIVDPGGCQWQLTRFLGQPETACREESWTILKSPKTISPLPWMRLGDITDILSKLEKERGNLIFWLGYAWGAIGGFWCGRSNLHVVGEADGVLQGNYGIQVSKGGLVPLITYGSKGLKRIGKDGNMFGSTCRWMGYLVIAQRRTMVLLLSIIF